VSIGITPPTVDGLGRGIRGRTEIGGFVPVGRAGFKCGFIAPLADPLAGFHIGGPSIDHYSVLYTAPPSIHNLDDVVPP